MQRGEGSAGCPDVGWHGVTWGDALTFVPREMLTPFPTCSVVLGGGGGGDDGDGDDTPGGYAAVHCVGSVVRVLMKGLPRANELEACLEVSGWILCFFWFWFSFLVSTASLGGWV